MTRPCIALGIGTEIAGFEISSEEESGLSGRRLR